MNPLCPENCAYDLPEVSYNTCSPAVFLSQVKRLFLAKANSAPLADWKTDTEWLARVSQNSKAGNDYIRAITCTGDKPAPSNNTKVIDNQQSIQVNKSHVLNFTTYNITDDNYEFMRGTECGTILRLFGWETMGDVMFGSNAGQLVSIVMDDILGGGDDDLETLVGQLTWKSKFSFERVAVSPLAGVDFNAAVAEGEFDTLLEVAEEVTQEGEGVTVTAPAINADTTFEFNKINPRVGAAVSMTVKVGATTKLVVDFPSDYTGQQFKYTDAAGSAQAAFAAGVVTVVPA